MIPSTGWGGRTAAAAIAVGGGASALGFALARSDVSSGAAAGICAVAVIVAGTVAALVTTRGRAARVRALRDGLLSFTEGDFGVRITTGPPDDLGEVLQRYNRLGDVLRAERSDVFQKERLLETVLDAAPMAVLLFDDAAGDARVAYANGTAREIFARGARLEGEPVQALLSAQPPEMRRAVTGGEDTLFATDQGRGERETFHAATRRFELRGRPHTLVLVKPLTREITRREALAYKNAVRVLSHELNNSLAPISSVVHSGRKLVAGHPEESRLGRVFEIVEERTTHLARFLESYARYAKLPRPVPRKVAWGALVEGVRALYPCRVTGTVPETPGDFDDAQMQQVVLNLLKNARESGSAPDDVELEVVAAQGGFEIWVRDRGAGMDDEVLAQAATPFFSTKPAGSGLGLALCREIVEAHGGALTLHRRDEGGIAVCCALPRRTG